ncbi:ABC transporter permease [Piscinibacter gummiphilus]|uniref:Sugar ABC transporter n=1 Tax=Piscinibacter gummiphilus TaxID=946333 RepID=A0A1W6LB16_9BURK|nr:ABC transporter permease [Piscinibacter gummiphilus]ARN21358.1 sugar ABC transporter [Piscinibacter gummiphilus]ATU66044.1 ABC transporter permease [Piscinibacter gummiphilus]GLS96296.1 ribose ABC transporter permease [Piscinibacter gummiphilus]
MSNPSNSLAAPSRTSLRHRTRAVLREAGIGVALVALVGVFAMLSPIFLTSTNITNIFTQISINVILAVGMTFVILIGGIDLSVGSVMAFCAVVAGTVLKLEGLSVGPAIALALLASVAVGAVCGLANGAISAYWAIPSFIVTLGMLNIARGAALQWTQARSIYEFPDAFNDFGSATVLGLPAIFLVALALVALGWFVLNRTVFGRLVYAIGNNEEAVRLAGHSVRAVKIAAFVICGAAVGVGAVIYMTRLTIASPISGIGFELNAIAAVIIGGTSLSGGRGSIVGTLLGACIIGVLANGLILIGMSDFLRQMVTGFVIILAVVLDVYRARLTRAAD